ncbi:unnamed protein product [Laminaria digitata]
MLGGVEHLILFRTLEGGKNRLTASWWERYAVRTSRTLTFYLWWWRCTELWLPRALLEGHLVTSNSCWNRCNARNILSYYGGESMPPPASCWWKQSDAMRGT